MPRKKKKADDEQQQHERDRRFEWEPGDITYTPPPEPPEREPEEIPPARRK